MKYLSGVRPPIGNTWADGTIYETRNENFVFFRARIAFQEASSGASGSTETLRVVDLERGEAAVAGVVIVCADGGVDHGFTVGNHDCTGSLTADFAGF